MIRGRTTRSEDWGRNTPQWKIANEGGNLDLALLLFYLPALEDLSLPLPFSNKEREFHRALGIGHGVDDGFWPLGTPPRASRLTTLHVRLQYAPEATLETILASTPALRTLHIVLNAPSTTTPVDCTAVRRALYQVEPTLESLTLAVSLFPDEACDPQNLGRVLKGRLGGGQFAQGFPALKSLHTSLPVLFGQSSSENQYVLTPGDTDWWSYDEDDEDECAVKGIKSADDPYHDMMLSATAELCGLLPQNLEALTIKDDLWFYDALPAWSGGKRTLGLLMAYATGSPISPRVPPQGLPLPRLHASSREAGDAGVSEWGPWKTATPRLRALNVSFKDEGTWCWDDEPGISQIAHLRWGCASQGLECRDIRPSSAPSRRI
ncbi:hypothetical protein PG988_014066 [Apiospora saccharicola]